MRTFISIWWSVGGSNSWPPACKAGALPAELWPHFNGREDRIRTCDPLVPNQMHYQAVLLPEWIGAPDRNRTHNLLIRSQTLYPIELLAQFISHFSPLVYITITVYLLQELCQFFLKNGAQGRNRTGTDFEVRRILSPVRLPVSPPGHLVGGSNRTWTDDDRVAVCCLTNLAMEPNFCCLYILAYITHFVNHFLIFFIDYLVDYFFFSLFLTALPL